MKQHKNFVKTVIITGLTSTMLLIFASLNLASTMVEPSRFLFSAKAGERVTGAIKVTNPSDYEAEINAVVYDWTLNDKDVMVTLPLGTRTDSLKGLIKFNPQRFKLAPGESQIVRFTITTPNGGELIERRGIVYFEEMISYIRQGIGANVSTRVGSTIYLSPDGIHMGFSLSKVYVEKRSDGKYQSVLEVANPGKGHVRYDIGYKIIDEKGALVNETQLPERVILPGFKRKIAFNLPEKMSPGKYNLLLNISFLGTNKKATRTIAFVVNK